MMGPFSSLEAVKEERMGLAFLGEDGAVPALVAHPQYDMAP